jgi:hypothetical protein
MASAALRIDCQPVGPMDEGTVSSMDYEQLLAPFGVLRGTRTPADSIRLLKAVLLDALTGTQRSWMLDDRISKRAIDLVDLARFLSFARRHRDDLTDVRVAWVTPVPLGESRRSLIAELPFELRVFEDTAQAFQWLAPND